MDESELLAHVAAGTDPLTALAATSEDSPKKPTGSKAGCLLAFILLAVALYLFCR